MIENGVNALSLIESVPVSATTFTRAKAMLEANFGGPIGEEKMALFFDLCREERWSEEQFLRTFKWFLKNKPFPAWTIADWFQYGVRVYPYAWYLDQQSKAGPYVDVLQQMDRYKLPDGTIVFKWSDGQDLPFEEIVAEKKSRQGVGSQGGSRKG